MKAPKSQTAKRRIKFLIFQVYLSNILNTNDGMFNII